jgi:hypothetical protein
MSLNLHQSREQLPIEEYRVHVKERENQTRTQADNLVDVTNKLQEARSEARGLNDKLLLYFIDMAIFYACETLANQSDLGEREKWS